MRIIIKSIFLLLIGILIANPCYSQESFERQYEFYYNGEGYCIQQLPDQGYLIGGFVSEYISGSIARPTLMRLDKYGELLWARPLADKLTAAIPTFINSSDGGVITIGTVRIGIDSVEDVVCIAKLDSQGSIRWINKITGTLQTTTPNDGGYAITRTSDSSYLAAFYIPPYSSDTNSFGTTQIIKFSDEGNTLWTRLVRISDTISGIRPFGVKQLSDDSYIIGGRVSHGDTLGIAMLKISSTGVPIWHKVYLSDTLHYNQGMTQMDDGSFIFCGRSYYGESDISLMKTDTEGNIKWSLRLDMLGKEVPTSVCQTLDGNILITGYMSFFPYGGYSETADSLLLLKLTPNGELLYAKGMNLPNKTTRGFAIIPTSDTGFVCLGTFSNRVKNSMRKRVLVVKSNSKGDLCNFQDYPINSFEVIFNKINFGFWDSIGISISSFTPPAKADFDFVQSDLCQSSFISQPRPINGFDFILYPSPIENSDLLKIYPKGDSPKELCTISITDIIGNTLISKQTIFSSNGVGESLDVSELPVGSYIVKISTNGEVFTSRISVVR